MVGALSGQAWAAIIAAAFWAVLVLFLALVLVNLFRLVESARALVDGIRQETVPLLAEVKATVSSLNRELDRVDGLVESAGRIVKSAERVSSVVEQAVSSPLIKAVAFGAGASRALRRLRREKG
ncbi:MAG TPA: DUF948 domain-containing protein [Actinomycetota bacterium]|nr:DUF948 domain-containing protein [Actinomycetota bacterium]